LAKLGVQLKGLLITLITNINYNIYFKLSRMRFNPVFHIVS